MASPGHPTQTHQVLQHRVARLAAPQVHHLALAGRLEALHDASDAVDEEVGVLAEHHGDDALGVHEPELGVGLVGRDDVGDAAVLQVVDDLVVQGLVDAVGELGEEGGAFWADFLS